MNGHKIIIFMIISDESSSLMIYDMLANHWFSGKKVNHMGVYRYFPVKKTNIFYTVLLFQKKRVVFDLTAQNYLNKAIFLGKYQYLLMKDINRFNFNLVDMISDW